MTHDPKSQANSPHVGYRHPPAGFSKGQSGNPSGRPKGAKNKPRTQSERLRSLMLKEAYRPIKVASDGQEITLPLAQAVFRSMAEAAAKGEVRAQGHVSQDRGRDGRRDGGHQADDRRGSAGRAVTSGRNSHCRSQGSSKPEKAAPGTWRGMKAATSTPATTGGSTGRPDTDDARRARPHSDVSQIPPIGPRLQVDSHQASSGRDFLTMRRGQFDEALEVKVDLGRPCNFGCGA